MHSGFTVCVASFLAFAAAAFAQDPVAPAVVATPSRARWSNGVAHIGNVSVDPRTRTVAAPGWVNMDGGAIELLACGPGGKTHESVLVIDVNPMDLQMGFLLLGLKPGTPPTALGEGAPTGPLLDVWVDWTTEKGKARSLRAEQLVFNEQTRRALPKTPWVFTGSVFEDGEFKAMAEQSLVATYWDPWAIVNIPLPCGSNDEILIVNRKTVPAAQTPVKVRFVAR